MEKQEKLINQYCDHGTILFKKKNQAVTVDQQNRFITEQRLTCPDLAGMLSEQSEERVQKYETGNFNYNF